MLLRDDLHPLDCTVEIRTVGSSRSVLEEKISERKRRRRFTAEYKAEAVKRLVESGRRLRDVAGELELSGAS